MSKVAVFIDNSNVFRSILKIKKNGDKSWECFYDPYQLAVKLAGNRELVSVNFYCVHPPVYLLDEDDAHKRKYVLTERYYSTIEKLPKTEVKYGDLRGSRGSTQEKNVDTQIVSDIITQAALSKFDIAIIVANDGDYVSAIENAKTFGKKIEVVYFRKGSSMNLRNSCDLARRARKAHFPALKFNKIVDLGGDKKEAT